MDEEDDEESDISEVEASIEDESSRNNNLQELITKHGVDNLYPPLDGTAFYLIICRINHSCDPNVIVRYKDSNEGLIAELHALKSIEPGEELFQSYIDQGMSYKLRQQALIDYGFICKCTKCLHEIE